MGAPITERRQSVICRPRVMLAAAAICIVLVTEWAWLRRDGGADAGPWALGVGAAATFSGGSFSLIDQHGRSVQDSDFRGRHMLIAFGYTACPDVCLLTLDRMAQIMTRLDADATRIQPIFITLDPALDTPAVLSKYLSNFDSRILGLTGELAELKRVTRNFRVFRIEEPLDEPPGYQLSHNAHLYLVDPGGKLLGYFRVDAPVEKVAATLSLVMAQAPARLAGSP